MPARRFFFLSAVWAVLCKDALLEFRTRYAISSLLMFALVALSTISMAVGAAELSPELTAALLWIILFFCAMTGLAKTFVQEQESGTIFALRIYSQGQVVFWGKLLFNIITMLGLTVFVIPLFLIFLNIGLNDWGAFLIVLLVGDIGIAAAATLTAAMVIYAQGKNALFTVLNFPVFLPQFLSIINATTEILAGSTPEFPRLVFMAGYDISLIIVAAMLFDYLWVD